MEKALKRNLLLYLFVSTIAYFGLVLPDDAGISVPIFALLQGTLILLITHQSAAIKNKWGYLFFIPIAILSLNSFTSANPMLEGPNFFVLFLLFSCLSLSLTGNFQLRAPSVLFFFHILENAIQPLRFLLLPFRWALEGGKGNFSTIKRILIGVLITVPCLFFLIGMLSAADMVFSEQFSSLIHFFTELIKPEFLVKAVVSLLAGFYLFCVLHLILASPEKKAAPLSAKSPVGDMIILSILLFSVLLLYTFFVILQFRYLFAQSALPFHLSYAEYARRGFFELVMLSILNVGLVLFCVWILKEKIYIVKSVWGSVVKYGLLYLCAITEVLLVSSFYRMSLYDSEYGLTLLRVLVYGFLLFEGIGLVFLVAYVLKPEFNIYAVCAGIMLCYYLTLNMVNVDAIIAKRNVDRFFDGKKTDLYYLTSLSPDAAPEIARLITKPDTTEAAKNMALDYMKRIHWYLQPEDWRGKNLSIDRALSIYDTLPANNSNS